MRTLDDWALQLGRSPVFGALSPSSRTALAAAGTPVQLTRGARLFSTGDPGDAAYLLLSGELEVGLSRADGGETWLASLAAGAIIGDMAVLDGGQRSADCHCRACVHPVAPAPRRCRRRRSPPSRRLRCSSWRYSPAACARSMRWSRRRRSLDIGARLARLLLQAERRETRSQSDLARIAGTTRESVNRKFAEWRVGRLDRRLDPWRRSARCRRPAAAGAVRCPGHRLTDPSMRDRFRSSR